MWATTGDMPFTNEQRPNEGPRCTIAGGEGACGRMKGRGDGVRRALLNSSLRRSPPQSSPRRVSGPARERESVSEMPRPTGEPAKVRPHTDPRSTSPTDLGDGLLDLLSSSRLLGWRGSSIVNVGRGRGGLLGRLSGRCRLGGRGGVLDGGRRGLGSVTEEGLVGVLGGDEGSLEQVGVCGNERARAGGASAGGPT